MAENSAQDVRRDVDRKSFVLLAIVFFIFIMFVTFLPMPPALWGYIVACILGRAYMRSSSKSLTKIILLGGLCGFGALIALLFLRATILSFLPPTILFLAVGTSIFFWLGSLWGYKMAK